MRTRETADILADVLILAILFIGVVMVLYGSNEHAKSLMEDNNAPIHESLPVEVR